MAVVTVRFIPRQQDKVMDYLFLTVGSSKLHASGLKHGDVDQFTFKPDAEYPLSVGFWLDGNNGGWEGPRLRSRHRVDITIDEAGHVSWKECEWPCWSNEDAR